MRIVLSLLALVLLIACETKVLPQSHAEQEGLSCALDDELQASIATYFLEHPVTLEKGWTRAIVIRKHREFTNTVTVSALFYTADGQAIPQTCSLGGSEFDLKTQPGADVAIRLFGNDSNIWESEVRLIRERALCIPEDAVPRAPDVLR